MLDVQIQIMNINGKIVKTLNTTIDGTDRSKPVPIPWDGTDDYGDSIGRGVYIYKIKVKTDSGMYAEKMEKLVILK
jgi:flagellar hook assembly protein FlgD